MFDNSASETILRGTGTEVVIGPCRPTVIIGNRLNTDVIGQNDMDLVRQEALAQVRDGAHVINVDLRCHDLDQETLAPHVVQAVSDAVSVPLCIQSDNPAALAAALQACPGKPLVNAISCKEFSLQQMLPVAVQHEVAVIGVAEDDDGVPVALEDRIEVGRHVLRMSVTAGVPREDVILDPLVQPLREDQRAAMTALETIAQLSRVEAVNLAARPRALMQGLPDGRSVATFFGALALRQGATCLFMDPAEGRQTALIADLLLAKDGAVRQYIDYCA